MAKTKAKAPEFDPRRADEAGQVYDFNDPEGLVTLKADDQGVVRVDNAREKRAADAFDLPVARKVLEAEKAAAAPTADTATDGAAADSGKEG